MLNMKRQLFYYTLALLLVLGTISSCDNYERTQVKPTITVNHNSVSLFEGEQIQLTASPVSLKYKWSTSDESIATVDASGLVTAVKQGTASVICASGTMSFSSEIIVVKKVALTGIELKCDPVLELGTGSTQTVIVTTIPAEANDVDVTDFSWWSDDESVARVSPGGVIKAMAKGQTTIHYRRGSFTKEITVVVDVTFPLFKGQPFVISKSAPSTLWFRDFDRGGMNNAFYDTGGGGGNTYRANNGDPTSSMVTIEGGGNIGYLASGEWYVYSIDVKDAGTYKMVINAAAGASGPNVGSYRYQIDGVDVWGPLPITGSGGWGTFIDFATEIALPSGSHKLKFIADNGSHNPKYMTFTFKQ